MKQKLRIIALLKQEVGSVAIRLSAGELRQSSFEFNPIDERELTRALQGLEREVRICRISSIEDCRTVLSKKVEWREAAIVLIDQPTVKACRPAGQSDDEPIASLIRLRSEHCSTELGRRIIGIFADEDEAVELINAGCHEARSLDNLAASIRSHLDEKCR